MFNRKKIKYFIVQLQLLTAQNKSLWNILNIKEEQERELLNEKNKSVCICDRNGKLNG